MDPRERLIVDDLLMRKVDEVSYLVHSPALYRPIVRLFQQRYESGETGWLWPGEVAAFIRQHHPHHPAYADEECEGGATPPRVGDPPGGVSSTHAIGF